MATLSCRLATIAVRSSLAGITVPLGICEHHRLPLTALCAFVAYALSITILFRQGYAVAVAKVVQLACSIRSCSSTYSASLPSVRVILPFSCWHYMLCLVTSHNVPASLCSIAESFSSLLLALIPLYLSTAIFWQVWIPAMDLCTCLFLFNLILLWFIDLI